jgi:hypothetical protein
VVLLYLTCFVVISPVWIMFNNMDGFSDKVMGCNEFFPFLLKVSW